MDGDSADFKCPACRGTEFMIVRQHNEAPSRSGRRATYWQEFFRCRGCDEEFLTAAQSAAGSKDYAWRYFRSKVRGEFAPKEDSRG